MLTAQQTAVEEPSTLTCQVIDSFLLSRRANDYLDIAPVVRSKPVLPLLGVDDFSNMYSTHLRSFSL